MSDTAKAEFILLEPYMLPVTIHDPYGDRWVLRLPKPLAPPPHSPPSFLTESPAVTRVPTASFRMMIDPPPPLHCMQGD